MHAIPRYVLQAVIAATWLTSTLALAQTWPTKPITLVVPYPAGGAADNVARMMAPRLEAELGTRILIDNRSGAASRIGTEFVVRAAPDGYTLLMGSPPGLVAWEFLAHNAGRKLSYDPARDLKPIAFLARNGHVLMVNAKVPIDTLPELIRTAQARPDELTVGNSGLGSGTHTATELLNREADIKLRVIPYRGNAPAMNDLISGVIQMQFDNPINVIEHLKAGKLRAIAISSLRRAPSLPDVPTFAELGYPNVVVENYWVLAAPAGTPQPVIDRVNTAVNQVLAQSDFKSRLEFLGYDVGKSSPQEAAQFLRSERARVGQLLTELKLTGE